MKKLLCSCCIKGANLIISGAIFQGVACGLIYRPLKSPKSRQNAAAAVERMRRPRSAILRNTLEEKRRRRTTSTGSLDGTMITKDNYVVKLEMSDSVSNNLQIIREDSVEVGPFAQAEVDESSLVWHCEVFKTLHNSVRASYRPCNALKSRNFS